MQEIGGVVRFKKYNPNPRPEPQLPDIEPFPEYDVWKSMKEAGTLPSEFDVTPEYDIPTPGATTPGRFVEPTRGGIAEFQDVLKPFEFGTPERIGRAEEFYEVPGELPTEEGMPIEEGIPPEFQKLMDFLGLTDPNELVDVIREATDKDLATLFRLAGVKEEEPTEEELAFPKTKEEAGQMILNKTMTKTQLESLATLGLIPKEWVEEPEADVQTEITKAIEDGAIYEDILDFLTNKETGLGLSNSEASKEIATWVENNQDIPLTRK